MLFVCLVLTAALVFEFINGFHDAANAIASVIATRVLAPRQALLLAAVGNVLGALSGTAVAATIGTGLLRTGAVTPGVILAALMAAIAWGLGTWWLGLPSSSSHALIGGLCGGALAATRGDWNVLHWGHPALFDAHAEGLLPKVILPMVASPLIGFAVALGFMALLACGFKSVRSTIFGRFQLGSAFFMAVSHGANDGQKTMGVITLILFSATQAGTLNHLSPALEFLRTPEFRVHEWVIFVCAIGMGLGTAVGGWRIIQTMGFELVELTPMSGFAAETAAAGVIQTASHFGVPLSTTHVISCAVMGVGATNRQEGKSAVNWKIVRRMVTAWVLTLPGAALLAYAFYVSAM